MQNNNKTIRRVVLDIDCFFFVCVCWFSFNQSGKVLPLYRNILHIYYRVYIGSGIPSLVIPCLWIVTTKIETEKEEDCVGKSSIK